MQKGWWKDLLRAALTVVIGWLAGSQATEQKFNQAFAESEKIETDSRAVDAVQAGSQLYQVVIRWRYSNRAFPGVDRFAEQMNVYADQRPTEDWAKANISPPVTGYVLEKLVSVVGILNVPKDLPPDSKN